MKNFTKTLLSIFGLMLIAGMAYSQMPDAITISPETATANDELTLTLNVSKACVPSGKNPVSQAGKVCMHSGYGDVAGNNWQNVVDWDKTGKDGTKTELTDNGDGTWSITFTPKDFYGIEDGVVATKITCVFNGCDNWASEAKDDDGSGGCTDFLVPIKFTNPNPSIGFKMNMNKLIKAGTLDPGLHQVFAQVTGFDPVELLDLDANLETDGIYEGIMEDTNLKEGNVVEVKFYYDDGSSKTYEDNPRSLTLVAGKNNVDAWWNDDPLNVTTFQVDMSAQIAASKFDPAKDYVDIAGSLNNWDGKNDHLTDIGGGWYEVKFSLEPDSTYEYKFRINGSWGNSEFPGGGPNRKYTARAKDYTVKLLYDNWDPSKWPVTFNCKMSYQISAGHFDPKSDFLDIAGNFNSWSSGSVLTDYDGDSIYSIVGYADTNNKVLEFKFRFNGDWSTSEFPGGGPNRSFTIMDTAGGKTNVFTAWYNNDDPAIPAKPIINDLKITGATFIDTVLTVSYTYEDVNGDPEGATIIQWLRADDIQGTNVMPIAGANSKTYTPTVDDNHKALGAVVIPVAASGDSTTMVGDSFLVIAGMVVSASLNESSFARILIYPNPADKYITVDNTADLTSIELYDLMGKKVRQVENIDVNRVEIGTANLKTGVYLLILRNKESAFTYKMIIK